MCRRETVSFVKNGIGFVIHADSESSKPYARNGEKARTPTSSLSSQTLTALSHRLLGAFAQQNTNLKLLLLWVLKNLRELVSLCFLHRQTFIL